MSSKPIDIFGSSRDILPKILIDTLMKKEDSSSTSDTIQSFHSENLINFQNLFKVNFVIKNKIISKTSHSEYYKCKNWLTEKCKARININKKHNENYYNITQYNSHNKDCCKNLEKSFSFDKLQFLFISIKYDLFKDDNFKKDMNVLKKFIDYNQKIYPFIYRYFLKNTLSNHKQDKITLELLQKYLESIIKYHTDDSDTPFCSFSDFNDDNFISTITTKKLLNQLAKHKVFAIDGTFKLSILGYIVVVQGYINIHRKFTLTSLTVTSYSECDYLYEKLMENIFNNYENYLRNFDQEGKLKEYMKQIVCVSDCHSSIDKGFLKYFPDNLHIFCYVHIKRNLGDNFPSIKSLKEEIEDGKRKKNFVLPSLDELKITKDKFLNDISYLQRSPNYEIFKKGFDILFTSYGSKDYLDKYLPYVEKNYVQEKFNWYEGCHPTAPKTNNANEGYNRSLKENVFEYRERYLIDILSLFQNVTNLTSKKINTELIEDEIVYEEVDEFDMSFYCFNDNEELKRYIIIERDKYDVEEEDHIELITSFYLNSSKIRTFEQFKMIFKMPIVEVTNEARISWNSFRCNCLNFRNKNNCVHINFIGSIEYTEENLKRYLGRKSRIGRPKNIKRNSALEKN